MMLPRRLAAAAAQRALATGRPAATAAAAAARKQQLQQQRYCELVWRHTGSLSRFSTAVNPPPAAAKDGAKDAAAQSSSNSSNSSSNSSNSSSNSSSNNSNSGSTSSNNEGSRRAISAVVVAAGALAAAGVTWALQRPEGLSGVFTADSSSSNSSSSSGSSSSGKGKELQMLEGWQEMRDEVFEETDDLVVLFLGGPQEATTEGPLISKLRGLIVASLQQQQLPETLSLFYAYRVFCSSDRSSDSSSSVVGLESREAAQPHGGPALMLYKGQRKERIPLDRHQGQTLSEALASSSSSSNSSSSSEGTSSSEGSDSNTDSSRESSGDSSLTSDPSRSSDEENMKSSSSSNNNDSSSSSSSSSPEQEEDEFLRGSVLPRLHAFFKPQGEEADAAKNAFLRERNLPTHVTFMKMAVFSAFLETFNRWEEFRPKDFVARLKKEVSLPEEAQLELDELLNQIQERFRWFGLLSVWLVELRKLQDLLLPCALSDSKEMTSGEMLPGERRSSKAVEDQRFEDVVTLLMDEDMRRTDTLEESLEHLRREVDGAQADCIAFALGPLWGCELRHVRHKYSLGYLQVPRGGALSPAIEQASGSHVSTCSRGPPCGAPIFRGPATFMENTGPLGATRLRLVASRRHSTPPRARCCYWGPVLEALQPRQGRAPATVAAAGSAFAGKLRAPQGCCNRGSCLPTGVAIPHRGGPGIKGVSCCAREVSPSCRDVLPAWRGPRAIEARGAPTLRWRPYGPQVVGAHIGTRRASSWPRQEAELLHLLQQQQQEAAHQLTTGALWSVWNPPGVVFGPRRQWLDFERGGLLAGPLGLWLLSPGSRSGLSFIFRLLQLHPNYNTVGALQDPHTLQAVFARASKLSSHCVEPFASLRLLLCHPSLAPAFIPGEGLLTEVWVYLPLPSSNSSSKSNGNCKERGAHSLLSPEFLAELYPRCAPRARIYYFFEEQQPQLQQQQQQQRQQQRTSRHLHSVIGRLQESAWGPQERGGPSELLFDFLDLGPHGGPPLENLQGSDPPLQLREDDAWLQGLAIPYSWRLMTTAATGSPPAGELCPVKKPLLFRLANGGSVSVLEDEHNNPTNNNPHHRGHVEGPRPPPSIQHEAVSIFYASLIRREPEMPNFRFKSSTG
ncbi:hypothetical protein Emag_006267 [Eimeria magna]